MGRSYVQVPVRLNAEYVRKAIEWMMQTAVAVSVMGTSRWKLVEIYDRADSITYFLVGDRPEIARVRTRIRQLMHDVRHVSTAARPASVAINKLAGGLRGVSALIVHGLTDITVSKEIGGFTVSNAWGYSDGEAALGYRALRIASKRLRELDMDDLATIVVRLDPRSTSLFAGYLVNLDMMAMDLSKTGDEWDVYYALASRLWRGLKVRERELWSGEDVFRETFADTMDETTKPSRETQARLQLSLGVEL